MSPKKIAIILAHAFVGWVLCAAIMGISIVVTSLNNALTIHVIAAPIFFVVISWFYFRKFNFTTPLQTATIFIVFVIAMDFFLVAMLINQSFEMFTSLLGTWIPFALIFVSTYLTGTFVIRNSIQGEIQ